MKKMLRTFLITLIVITSLSFASGSLALVANNAVIHADTVSEVKGGVTDSGGTGDKNQGKRVAETLRIVVNILLFLIGAFAVIMIVIAGFRFVGSNGDTNTVSSARNTILYSVIGLVVAFLAFALVNFIINQITR